MRKVAFLALAAVLSGCALTDFALTMPVTGLATPIPGGAGREVIVMAPFRDARQIRHRCGMKKNGYNMDTADATCNIPPDIWLAQILTDELRASGFKIIAPGAPRRPGALVIEGDVLKVFVEPVIGAWSGSLEADLSVKLVATSDSGLRAERTFFVKGTRKGVIAITATPYQSALERATNDLVSEMVEAILQLMNTYPQLGSWNRSQREES
jgi:hypothetical protein